MIRILMSQLENSIWVRVRALQLALMLAIPLLAGGCASQFAALQNNRQSDIALEELRVEVADLKHALHAAEVEISLLEERLETPSKTTENLSTLQHKIAVIERNQDKLSGEIRTLSTHANQMTSSLSHYRDQIQNLTSRFEDLEKIKNTLSSISKSIGRSQTSYKVKAGDSLEKIARHHNTSVEAIKKANHLQTDRIVVGQELLVPNG